MQLFTGIFLGLLVSFIGQLPVGALSITATQIAVQENYKKAWKYSFGVTLIEMLYLRIILSFVLSIIVHPRVLLFFNGIVILILLGIGFLTLITSGRQKDSSKSLLLNNQMDRFVLGLVMSALNPAQIPFWIIWSGYFLSMGWIHPDFEEFNFFTLGSGIGTLAGLAVYIYGGNWLVTKMRTSNMNLNQAAGVIFILAALFQLYRIFYP